MGLLKMPGMARELGPGVVAMMRAVKQALDPRGILNPGNLMPDAPTPYVDDAHPRQVTA